MTTPVAYVGKDSTYAELQEVVLQMSHVRAFPLVENKGRSQSSERFCYEVPEGTTHIFVVRKCGAAFDLHTQ